jgi:putative PIN family toxin of toxin-antitoxin system
LLAAVRAGEIELVTREDCHDEWLAVLAYPQLKLDEGRHGQAIEMFDAHVRRLSFPPCDMSLPRCRDRDDQKFLELAYQAKAVALLTRDDELLRLARRAKRDGLFAILKPNAWRDAL